MSILHEQLVQFYENDDFLMEGLLGYVGSALSRGTKASSSRPGTTSTS